MNHQRLKSFAQSKKFCHIVNYAIISFAFLMGLETILKNETWQAIFRVIDYFYLAFFSIEIILRILAEDHPLMYFVLVTRKKVMRNGVIKTALEFTEHGFWNYFDFALISLSIFGLLAQAFLHPSFIQIGRLFRIFRIVRLLEISDHLKEVERRIMSILPTVFSFIVLLLILNYIYAVLGMFMFGNHIFATCDFSSLIDSFVTLFQVMTLDNWSDVMHDLKANAPEFPGFIIQFYFVSFVVFTSIIAFNVFIAVMTSQVQDKMERELAQSVIAQSLSTGTGEVSNQEKVTEGMKEIVSELRLLKAELSDMRNRLSSH